MKSSKVTAVAEIVSSIAILVTLAYLTIQTRQNTEALHANSRQATMAADIEFLTALMDNPEIEANVRLPELSPTQESQIQPYVIAFMRIREFAWFQYKSGVLDETTWISYMAATSHVLAPERARRIWEQQSEFMDREFVAYVNDFLGKTTRIGEH
ncbi:MAG: hypothetical protein JRH01_05990 [Deltaproteobacteria bacterium]|nr:hypothetical protein [Deltaproteobacteria bacterium]